MDARRTPKRVLLAHAADEITDLLIDLRAPTEIAGFPAPIGPKTHVMPAYDGLRPNDRDGIADIRKKSIEQDEDRPI